MTKLIVDTSLTDKLSALQGAVELCDESGQIVGYFHPVMPTAKYPRSPIPLEELERRSREGGGRALAEILAELNRQ